MDGRSLSDLMSYENPLNLSETITKWGALAKAHVPQRVGGAEFPYMHKYISVYAKKYFRIYENKSPYIRKFIGAYTGAQRPDFARRLAREVRGEGALSLR